MRNWIEVTGKTVEDAITDALVQLGSARENVDIEVLEKESSGFLGINRKPAKVRAAVKETIQDKAVNFLEQVFELMEIAESSFFLLRGSLKVSIPLSPMEIEFNSQVSEDISK